MYSLGRHINSSYLKTTSIIAQVTQLLNQNNWLSFTLLKLVTTVINSTSYVMASNKILSDRRETKNEPACKLVPTLESWNGMVKNEGAPYPRRAQKCPAHHTTGRCARKCRRVIYRPFCFMHSGTTVARWICAAKRARCEHPARERACMLHSAHRIQV